MTRFIALFIFSIVILSNCSKPSDPGNPVTGQKPGHFTVSVSYRTETDAAIEWTAASDTSNKLLYDIYLNGVKVDSNRTVLNDTLKGLLPDSIYNGHVIAINRNGDTSGAPFQLPAFEGYLHVYDNKRILTYYNIATGKSLWSASEVYITYGIPSARNKDTLFHLSYSLNAIYLMATNMKTGAVIWTKTIDRPTPPLSPIQYTSSMAYENGKLVFIVMSDFYVCSSKDGSAILRSTIEPNYSFQTQPVVAGGILYIGGLDEKLHAIDISTGVSKWVFNVREELWRSNPSIANGMVYFGTEEGSLFALNATTGAKVWSIKPGTDAILSAPLIEGTTLYISMSDGNVYALDALTGKIKWTSPAGSFETYSPAIDK